MNIKTFNRLIATRQAVFAIAICAAFCAMICTIGCQGKPATENAKPANEDAKTDSKAVENGVETSLFDGQSLDGWLQTQFGGQVEATVVDGEIVMDAGSPMAGINRSRDEKLPKSNYEISLDAKRTDGIDFFCGLTFPVQDSFCTLIVAGWAGATVGLSNVDGGDASSNDTTLLRDFQDDRWYRIKVKVTDEAITCWIDDEQVIHQEIEGHEISYRADVTPCRPLGLCAFESAVAYRNIVLTQFEPTRSSDSDNRSTGN